MELLCVKNLAVIGMAVLAISGFAASSYQDRTRIRHHNKVIACYLNSTSFHNSERPYTTKFSQFEMRQAKDAGCTQLIFGAAELNPSDFKMRSLYADLNDENGIGNLNYRTIRDELRYTEIESILSISGRSNDFSEMARNVEARKAFVFSVNDFISRHEFHGVNIDWRFPGSNRGGEQGDKENFVALVMELKRHLRQQGKRVTAFLPHDRVSLKNYDLKELSQYLDFIYILSFDYHGAWDYKVLPSAPLRSHDSMDIDNTLQYYSAEQVPRHKLVLGIPFYGRSYTLKNPLTRDESPIGKHILMYSGSDPVIFYNKICQDLKRENWRINYDPVSSTTYAILGERVMVYEDQRSIFSKLEFASAANLTGVMAYAIEMDDVTGACSMHNVDTTAPVKFPLLQTIHNFYEREANSAHFHAYSVLLLLSSILISFRIYFL